MNWDAIGAVGEMVGGFAFLLAVVQIRHVRSDTRRAIARERAKRVAQMNLAAATNERLASLRTTANEALRAGEPIKNPFMKAATEQLSVTSAEAFMLNSDQMSRWSGIAHTLDYSAELSPGDEEQFHRLNRVIMTEPLFRLWYESMKPLLNPDAVRYVDNVLRLPVTPNWPQEYAIRNHQAEGMR